jgi:hypothetical protein
MHTANRQWFGKLVLKGIAQSYWTKQHVTIKIVICEDCPLLGNWNVTKHNILFICYIEAKRNSVI